MYKLENTVNQTFLIKSKLSSGTFGIVYSGIDLRTHEEVAIKMSKTSNTIDTAALLMKESKILSRLQGLTGIPALKWHGNENDKSYLVMSLHSRDLGFMVKKLGRLSLKTVVMLGEKLINLLETIHRKGILHRDIKPENILVGKRQSARELFLVDYGISKVFKDSLGRHLKYSEGKKFVGTCRYSSLAAHKGREIGRKDDLENLGYVLIYLLKGKLPWQRFVFSAEEKYTKVGALKEETSIGTLCHELPEEFHQYFEYLKKLDYYEKPDYKYLRSLFYNLASAEKLNFDYNWDWLSPTKPNSDSSIYQRESREHRRSSIECSVRKLTQSKERHATFDFFPNLKDSRFGISEVCEAGSDNVSRECSFLARDSVIDEFHNESNLSKKMESVVTTPPKPLLSV